MTRATDASTIHDTHDYQTTRRSLDSASTRLTFRVNLMQGHDEAAYARRQKSETGQNAKNKIKIRGNCSLALSPFLPSSLPPLHPYICLWIYGSIHLSITHRHTHTHSEASAGGQPTIGNASFAGSVHDNSRLHSSHPTRDPPAPPSGGYSGGVGENGLVLSASRETGSGSLQVCTHMNA